MWCQVGGAFEAKRTTVPGQSGVAKEEMISLFTRRGKKTALAWIVRSGLTDLDYAQNLWDGCFRGGYGKDCSPGGSITDASGDCLVWEQ
jgi:hypothetical protein